MLKFTVETILDRCKQVHSDRYDYSQADMTKSVNSKTTIICKEHGPWEQLLRSHMAGYGCSKCKNIKLSKNEFLLRAEKVHDNRYDYSESEINGVKGEIIIICKIHGKFNKIMSVHLRGAGCPKCSRVKKNRVNQNFIDEANLKHNFQYNYSKTVFTKVSEKVIIICPKHGEFKQTANNHLQGQGCKICGVESITSCTKEFVKKANLKHNFKYSYVNAVYVNSAAKIEIICPNHGSFFQKSNSHLEGSGCPDCCNHISEPETLWLDSLNILKINRSVKIKHDNKRIIADGFDPMTNTVYEFNGDYWHGNPKFFKENDLNKDAQKTYGELYQKTLEKEAWLKSHGYNVVSIWESDWNAQVKANKLKDKLNAI